MTIQVTQFWRPNGRQTQESAEVSDQVQKQYLDLREAGGRLTAEVLRTGQVSVCIEHPEVGDFDIEVILNGPEVQKVLEKMLTRFDLPRFLCWVEREGEDPEEEEGEGT